MKRYGYLDQDDMYSDISEWTVTVTGHCPACRALNCRTVVAEDLGGLELVDGIYPTDDIFVCDDCEL